MAQLKVQNAGQLSPTWYFQDAVYVDKIFGYLTILVFRRLVDITGVKNKNLINHVINFVGAHSLRESSASTFPINPINDVKNNNRSTTADAML